MKSQWIVLAVFGLLALAPPVSAQTTTTVLLHDLYDSEGSYLGCHVTTPAYGSYRLNVAAGTDVSMTVQAPANNTNVHFLTVESVSGQSDPVTAGQSTTFTFTAPDAPGTYAVRCNGEASNLQGTMRVQASADTGASGNDTPFAGVLAILAAGFAAAGLARRHRS